MRILISWLISTLAIMFTGWLLAGVVVTDFTTALIASLILGLVNAIIRPILLILTLPINILTLGLFTFIINAALVLLVARILDGFYIHGFIWALAFSVILSIVVTIMNTVLNPKH